METREFEYPGTQPFLTVVLLAAALACLIFFGQRAAQSHQAEARQAAIVATSEP